MKTTVPISLLIALLLLLQGKAFAQTGPGGVGNNSDNRLWLRADAITGVSNGQRLTTWSDQSGNANNASQTVWVNKPKYYVNKINGLPAVYFNGNAHYMTCGTNLSGNNASIFIVMNKPAAQVNYRFVLVTEKHHIASRFQNAGDKWGSYFYPGGEHPTSVTLNSSYSILTTLADGTSSMTVDMYTNGGSLSSYGVTSFPIKATTTIGALDNGSSVFYYARMNLAELIYFNTVVNRAQQIIIENYLGAKYNISISNDKYAYQGVHSYELAGIGREDASNEHTDAQGSGIVRINSPSSLDNGDYLLFAHDNATLATTGSDVPTTYVDGRRLTRTWRAGETGETGTVTLTFDMTGIEFGDPNTYELLTDADGVFASGASSQTADSYNTTTHILTFLNVNLNDGDYFTVGNPNNDIISVQTGLWNDPNTWNCQCVPDSFQDPTIDNTHTVTIAANAKAQSVKINPTGTLTTSGSPSFRILGDLSVDGTFTPGSASVTCPGGNAQTFTNNTASAISFTTWNIDKSANSLTLSGGNFEVTNVLNITGGALDPAGLLTLSSTASSTARIAPTSSGSITGNVIIQRYISARNADWADLACPASGTTLSDWDQEIYMSGVGGVDGNACCPIFYSVWEYNENATKWDSLTSVATALNPGQGYELFLGHDLNNWNGGVFDSRGVPVTGDQSISVTRTGSDGWNLVGNPFASYVSWTSISNDIAFGNIDDNFQIYDAGTQSYLTYGDGDEIPPHQGFWVHSSSGTPSMTIRESHKTTTTTSTFHKKAPEENALILTVSSDMNKASHEARIKFRDEARKGRDPLDAFYKASKAEWAPGLMSYNTDGDPLVWNVLPQLSDEITIPLDIDCGLSDFYRIHASGMSSLQKYDCVILEDLETNELIDLGTTDTYNCYVAENKNGHHEPRFLLHFSSGRDCQKAAGATDRQIRIFSHASTLYIRFAFPDIAKTNVSIYNMLGQKLYSEELYVSTEQMEFDALPLGTGLYIVKVSTSQGSMIEKIKLSKTF